MTPSLGFANASLKFGRLNITLFDVGGGPTIRDIWSSYYADVHGFIYVVDSTDSKRLQEMAENLRTVMMEPMLQGKPCLMLVDIFILELELIPTKQRPVLSIKRKYWSAFGLLSSDIRFIGNWLRFWVKFCAFWIKVSDLSTVQKWFEFWAFVGDKLLCYIADAGDF